MATTKRTNMMRIGGLLPLAGTAYARRDLRFPVGMEMAMMLSNHEDKEREVSMRLLSIAITGALLVMALYGLAQAVEATARG